MISSDCKSEMMSILNEVPSHAAFTEARGVIDSWGIHPDQSEVSAAASPVIDRWPSELRAVRTTWDNLAAVVEFPSWQLVRTLEILSVDTLDDSDSFSTFIQSPKASQLRTIVWHHELNDGHIRALVESKYTSELESLALSVESISDDAMALLAKSHLPSQLLSLRLTFPPPTFTKSSQAYKALFSNDCLSRLVSLTAIFPPDGFINFVNANRPKQLNALRLQLFDPTSSFEELIRSSDLLMGLQSLQMPCSNLGNQRVRELLKSPCIQELSSLDLTDNNVDADGLRSFSDSVCLPTLSVLHLGLNDLGDKGWKIIGKLKCNHLAKLCLDKTQGGDLGVQFLSQSWTGAALRVLSVQDNGIGPGGTAALSKSGWAGKLSELWLDNNPLGDDGASALAKGDGLTNLETLCLRQADIGSRGFSAILDDKNNCRLRVLLLDGASLSDAPFRKLTDASFSSALRELSLAACDVGNSEIGELCSSDRLPQLRVLRLALNHFDEAAVHSLKSWATFHQLWEVDMSHIKLDDRALAELGTAGALHNVAELRIEGTDTSSVGVKNCLKYMPRLKLLVHHEFRNWTQ